MEVQNTPTQRPVSPALYDASGALNRAPSEYGALCLPRAHAHEAGLPAAYVLSEQGGLKLDRGGAVAPAVAAPPSGREVRKE